MADDDTMPHDTLPDEVAPDDAPVVDRGECPICGVEFDDPEVFRDHLGEVHDLYDEEGATTTTLWIPTFAVEAAAEVDPIPETPTPPPAAAPAPQRAPAGLIVFVVLLIALGAGLVIYIQSNGGSDTSAEGPRVSAGGSPGSATASGSGETTDTATTADSTSSPTDGSAAGATPAEATTPTSGAPSDTTPLAEPPPDPTTPVTTAPPATFVAPTTTAAQVDGCSRDHGRWVVTYSWQYVGGTDWAPLAAYSAIGGGRYQDTVSVPANGNTPIATVGVVDANGTRHDVALSPTLSAANC